jgi:hypothetical protein
MIPIENFITCSSKLEKLQRERYYIQSLNGTLNFDIPGKLLEIGKIEYHKQYNSHNYLEKKEHFKQQCKTYREQNFEQLKKICKCECGGRYTYTHKLRHSKSKKHQIYVKIQEIILNHKNIISDIDKIIFDTNQFIISMTQKNY